MNQQKTSPELPPKPHDPEVKPAQPERPAEAPKPEITPNNDPAPSKSPLEVPPEKKNS